MKLSRRGMFGVAAGGAAAAASGQLGGLPSMPPANPAPYYGDVGAKQAISREWTLERLAEIKRIASGDIRDGDRNYPTMGAVDPYAPLKSISEHARHYLRDRRQEIQWRERFIRQALETLDQYDKTGILRTLF